MKIFLDDVRNPPDESWITLRKGSVLAGMLMIHDGEVEVVSFDHDLADFSGIDGRECTGYTYLCQIESLVSQGLIKNPPRMEVHSANPVGRKKMQAAIDSIERMILAQESRTKESTKATA